jgi:hypothetical protein
MKTNQNIKFDKLKAEEHLQKLLKKHNIRVVKWSSTSCGRAWVKERKVKIPHPTNIDRFCVAMHEIGHVVKGASKKNMKLYKSEFIAEMFAIEQAELLGFDCTLYKERARRYIIMNIAKGYCRKLNLETIEQEVKEFCNINFKEWEGKKVYISGWGINTYKGEPLEVKIIKC